MSDDSDHSSSSDETQEQQKRVRGKRRKYDPDSAAYHPKHEEKIPKKPVPKDFGAPKRPLSAFNFYFMDSRPAYKKANPDMKITEIMKGLAAKWKESSEEEKKEYITKAAEAKAEYTEQRKKYTKSAKYKRFKRELKDWNELYKEEFEQQQIERKAAREKKKNSQKNKKKTSAKKNPKKKAASKPKKKSDSKSKNKKKSKSKK